MHGIKRLMMNPIGRFHDQVSHQPYPTAHSTMAAPNEKLANSLAALRRVTSGGRKIINAKEIGRVDRERLTAAGHLSPVTAGWLMLFSPSDKAGDTTAWYASFWEFCSRYLNERFGQEWAIGPHNSIPLHAGNMFVPKQILIQAPGGNNQTVPLPGNCSIFTYRASLENVRITDRDGLRMYSLPDALAKARPSTWTEHKDDIVALLGAVSSPNDLLAPLLDDGEVNAAGRLAGAFRILGRKEFAQQIVATMKRADYVVRMDSDPFAGPVPLSFKDIRPAPPVVTRIRLMWAQMRDDVIACFPEQRPTTFDSEAFMKDIDEAYVSDAYHSLSIEGYQVSEELIERVRRGDYEPEANASDKDQKNAMAAKGYWQTFQAVRRVVEQILEGADPGHLVELEHQNWYQTMFEPSVRSGLLKASSLIGYRTYPVYLRGSQHVPTQHQVVPDAMAAFFECLKAEEDARVRSVLGHFIFTFIHPFPDGNGRTGRFLMNSMLASGRYPWTVIPVSRRAEYMVALEAASVDRNIKPFARFIASIMGRKHKPEAGLIENPVPSVEQNAENTSHPDENNLNSNKLS